MTTSASLAQVALSTPRTPCPTSAAISAARSAEREPISTCCPARASRNARPRPCSPVPPRTPTTSPETSGRSCGPGVAEADGVAAEVVSLMGPILAGHCALGHDDPMDAARVALLRQLLDGTEWVSATQSFARSLRRSTKARGDLLL